jgi:Bacterial Ig-like domain
VVETFDVTSPRLTWAATQVTIDPTSNLAPGVSYYVQIAPTAVKDSAALPYAGIVDPDTTSWSFTTDGTAPAVVSLSPAGLAKADPGTRLLTQFSEAVQLGTGTVTIHKTSDNSLIETIDVTTPGAVVLNNKVVAIVRSTPLAAGAEYYVNVTAGAFQDASGNGTPAITGSTAWKFTTHTAVPIIVENFSAASTQLNTTSADIFATEISSAGGVSTWGAGTTYLGNGVVTGAINNAAFLNLGSYINNSKGTAAGKFDLSMTIAETSGSWVSLGFVTGVPSVLTQNFTAMGGLATIIYRSQSGVLAPNTNGELDMFGGPNNANGVDGPDANTGIHTLTVTLDLTPTGGYDGVSNFGTVSWSDSVLGQLGSYIYTINRSFDSILITQGVTTTTINALTLHQTKPSNTFASWIGGFSLNGLTGVNDDFDGDGLGNAIENLLGSSPQVFSPGLTGVTLSGGNLAFHHTRSTTPASDLTGSYEWSTDLITWHGSGVAAEGTTVTFAPPVVNTPGTPELVEVTASITGSASKVFARFKATRN